MHAHEQHYHEQLTLSASGGPLELNSSTNGYNGEIHLFFFAGHLENYTSPFVDANQVIVYSLEFTSDQVITYSFDEFFTQQETGLKLHKACSQATQSF